MQPTRFPELTRRFLFTGYASSFAGQFFLPEKVTVESTDGSSALGVSGGVARSANEGLQLSDFLATAGAETEVVGLFTNDRLATEVFSHRRNKEELPTRTSSRATLRGLRISKDPVFTAEQVSAELIAMLPDGKGGETRFAIGADTGFRELAVVDANGKSYPLVVSLNTNFIASKKYETRSKLMTAPAAVFPRTYVRDETPRGTPLPKGRGLKSLNWPKPRKPTQITSSRGPVYATIVKSLKWAGEPYPGAEINENILQIPNLGLIFFGELLVESHQRRLTMVRFELGSYAGGSGDGVDVGANGSWYP